MDMHPLQEKLTHCAALTESFMKGHTARFYGDEAFAGFENCVKPLFESFEYSLFAGGKRLRPFLVMEFCAACGKNPETAVSYAAAMEMIHTFSLIHDDLPCMDNDDLRRGKPTNHKVYGEACALLAGDALAFYAFEAAQDNAFSAETNLAAVRLLAHGAGVCGMIAGQQIDMWAENHAADEKLLTLLQQKKTGALFETACLLGCLAAGKGPSDPEFTCARTYAAHIGLAFQITDDILDVCGDESLLGKHVGSDAENGKVTFVSLLGLERAREKAAEEIQMAKDALETIDCSRRASLAALADYILERKC